MTHPRPHPGDRPVRILCVLDGGEETTEMRLLAPALDPARYRIDAVICGDATAPEGMEAAGIAVDRRARGLGEEAAAAHLMRRIAGCEIVIAFQEVPALSQAMERLHHRPPLICHARRPEALPEGTMRFATRLVATDQAIRAAAASRMLGRADQVLAIPPMVDLSAFRSIARGGVRARLGLEWEATVLGWIDRPDAADGLRRFLDVAAMVSAVDPAARFLIAGAEDAAVLAQAIRAAGLSEVVTLAGRSTPLPDLLAAMDVLVTLPRSAAMPHSTAFAGAAGLPVVLLDASGSTEIRDGITGLVASSPRAAAAAILRLARDERLRHGLGRALGAHVAATCSTEAVAPIWEALFDAVLAETPAPPPRLFRSFMQGGFECSTQRLVTGRRLDVIAATGHDTHAAGDYRQLGRMGLHTLRDGLRWHLVETAPGRYDFSSFLPMARAARQAGAQVIWDLLHYGWPDDIDIWSPAFVTRFAAFARAAALAFRETGDEVPFWCPVNEISFFAWAGGDVAYLNPFATGRGFELKVQLARAGIAAMRALREVDARARFVHCEPLIAIHHNPALSHPRAEAEAHHQSQFQAADLLSGRIWPQIGGDPSLLDIVGVNYYPNNQWMHPRPPIDVDHPAYRPLSDLLFEVHARTGRPLLLAETGVEDHRRPSWLRYVAAEVARARRRGIPVEGLCLYPVMNHPGWDDGRECRNGLLARQFDGGARGVETALAQVVAELVAAFPGAQGQRQPDDGRSSAPALRRAGT